MTRGRRKLGCFKCVSRDTIIALPYFIKGYTYMTSPVLPLIGGESFFSKKSFTRFALHLNAVISTNESTQFITGHIVYNLAYT